MNERTPRRRPRATVDDPYAKPWVARDAAKNVVKQAVASGSTPSEMIDHRHGIFRPDDTAVVERSFAWAARFRRLAKDDERLPETVVGRHFVAFTCLMLHRAVVTLGASP